MCRGDHAKPNKLVNILKPTPTLRPSIFSNRMEKEGMASYFWIYFADLVMAMVSPEIWEPVPTENDNVAVLFCWSRRRVQTTSKCKKMHANFRGGILQPLVKQHAKTFLPVARKERVVDNVQNNLPLRQWIHKQKFFVCQQKKRYWTRRKKRREGRNRNKRHEIKTV